MEESSDGGGCLIWVGLGAALVIGAGFLMWFRVGPARPPVAPMPVSTTSRVKAPVTEQDLAWAKGAGVALRIESRKLETHPDQSRHWTFDVELANGGTSPVEVVPPSESNVYLETRGKDSTGVYSQSSDDGPPYQTLKPGESAPASLKFASVPQQGECRLVHVEELKDGTRRYVASEWFPLEEGK